MRTLWAEQLYQVAQCPAVVWCGQRRIQHRGRPWHQERLAADLRAYHVSGLVADHQRARRLPANGLQDLPVVNGLGLHARLFS